MAAFVNPITAQVGGQVETDTLALYFTDKHPPIDGSELNSITDIPCGTQKTYDLTIATPNTTTTPGAAFLNRAALEAGSELSCTTDWVYMSHANMTLRGHANVTFPLNCERPGLIQPILDSVEIIIMQGSSRVGKGLWNDADLPGFCSGSGAPYEVEAEIPVNGTMMQTGQALTVRLDVKAVNTESHILPYWYVLTAPRANMTVEVEQLPECRDTLDNDGDGKIDFGTGTTHDPGCSSAEDDDETDSNPEPQCSDGLDNDNDGKIDFGSGANNDPGCSSTTDDDETDNTEPTGDVPGCARDDPPEAESSRPVGETFALTAMCTDPDDDLETGQWTDNDQPAGEETLGASPDEVSKEFTYDTPGSHVIELTPTDAEGQEGAPASWVVHVVDNSGGGEAPSCARDEPSEFDVSRPKGESFTLSAVCTDADDDLDAGEWVVDDEPAAEDDLGDSPATAEEEFKFDDCGTHHISFVPSDQAGNVGSAATWRVTVTGCASPSPSNSPSPSPTDSGSPSPTQTTPIPVFPSSLAFMLAAAGGLGGGFLILRRRGA